MQGYPRGVREHTTPGRVAELPLLRRLGLHCPHTWRRLEAAVTNPDCRAQIRAVQDHRCASRCAQFGYAFRPVASVHSRKRKLGDLHVNKILLCPPCDLHSAQQQVRCSIESAQIHHPYNSYTRLHALLPGGLCAVKLDNATSTGVQEKGRPTAPSESCTKGARAAMQRDKAIA